MMCVWRLFVAYIGPTSRTERSRKTKIGTEVDHVTRDSDTSSKVKMSTCRGRGYIVAASRTACLSLFFAFVLICPVVCNIYCKTWNFCVHLIFANFADLLILPKKTWCDCVKNDMESLGLSQKDAQSRNKWRRRIKGGNWLTLVHLEKWP